MSKECNMYRGSERAAGVKKRRLAADPYKLTQIYDYMYKECNRRK